MDVDSHIDSLLQDGSNSSALAMELLQSCAKPSIYASSPPHPNHEKNIFMVIHG